jgi:hypothetical protein
MPTATFHNRRSVLGLAVLVTLAAIQYYGVLREKDLTVLLSSSLPADKMNDNSCSHQASHLVKPIILDFTEIKATNNQRLIDIKGFTEPKHEQWISKVQPVPNIISCYII